MSVFDRFRSGPSPEELEAQANQITLPQTSPVMAELQGKMGYYQQRAAEKLNRLEGEHPNQPKGSFVDMTKEVTDTLFDLYKYRIRLELTQSGHVDKQMLANQLRAQHPTRSAQFQDDLFNEAFDIVKFDIERKLREAGK